MLIWSTHRCASTRGSQTINTSEVQTATGQTGHANWSNRLDAENPRRPRTSSSGWTPSELEDLGLSWGRQATQDALEQRRDARRTAKGLKKLGFEKKGCWVFWRCCWVLGIRNPQSVVCEVWSLCLQGKLYISVSLFYMTLLLIIPLWCHYMYKIWS